MKIIISILFLLTPSLSQHFYPSPTDRAGYTISHPQGGATSSVNINFQPQIHSQQDYTQSYLTELANKQQLATNPQQGLDILTSSQPENLYNVGYSINIENNNTPKLTYRYPMPKNAHSYRQQKLLNADIITGTHKDNVEKPYEYAITNYISSEPNYQEKTKVYTNAGNMNGYTWKTLSPGVEISSYNDISQQQKVQAQSFDHAAALGKSQGFDITNVVENGNPYQGNKESQALTEVNTKTVEPSKNFNKQVDVSTLVLDTPKQYKSGDVSFNSAPFKHNLFSSSNIEIDKSLLDGFYKNYNPLFYQPEITLPSPKLPKTVNLNLHTSASHQFPTYNLNYQAQALTADQNMINQHYAFVQASEVNSPNNDIKPVTEQQDDLAPQHTHQQHVVQPQQQQLIQQQPPIVVQQQQYLEQKKTEHKKFVPSIPSIPASALRYQQPIYGKNIQNIRVKPRPPMLIIHQKY